MKNQTVSSKNKKVVKNKLRAPKKGIVETLKVKAEKAIEQVENVFSSRPKDVEAAIKMDHEGLRNFLKTLKDVHADMTVRRQAYKQFAALLKSHSLCEEQVVYEMANRLPGREMHIKIAEGYVEHQLADDLMARIEKTKDPITWSAHANVLSEIMEHHLDEEERDLLPLIRKASTASVDAEMMTKYVLLRGGTQKKVTPKNSGVLKVKH